MEFKLNESQLELNNKIVYIKTLLHQYVYTEDFIAKFARELESSIELFSIHTQGTVITLKIKKTTLKKNSDYEHDSLYYYSLINQIIYNFIQRESVEIYNRLVNILRTLSMDDIMNTLADVFTIPMLYNITSLADNIVMIYL